MKVCVIGAGAAGLCAAKHLTHGKDRHTVVVYEQEECLGGTWVYHDVTDSNLHVHSSMYKSLRTNLPKEVMGFPDFPIPAQDKSYLPAADILTFLNLYADKFRIRQHIKFQHQVKRIEPADFGWTVTVADIQKKSETSEHFDAVMVCNGHYHTPQFPDLDGQSTFPGMQLHSHLYRVPAPMADKTVVVLGAGPSGLDLALEISTVAKQVILSHHVKEQILTKFPDNVIQKQDVQSVSGSFVTFKDGSQVPADVLFYCTGYKYSFPFLSPECGVYVENNCVQPLYKHLIHIHRPTMCFIGLPFYVCAFTMFDLQVRYFLRVLSGELVLPSAEEMLRHTQSEIAQSQLRGDSPRQFHMMGPRQAEYYDSLSCEADLPLIPPVLTALHNHSGERFLQDLTNYREDVFRIIDDRTFEKVS